MHAHLPRLSDVWQRDPVFFVTTVTKDRRRILATEPVHRVLQAEFAQLNPRYAWMVGRYVIMPDHVHFFIAPTRAARFRLHQAVGKWKDWSAKRLAPLGFTLPLWEISFFDHLLRSEESRSDKWSYIRENPVRAGLVPTAKDWPYAGAIDFE